MKSAELSARALLLGILLSVVLAAANAYLGLFAGMTVSASIPAAVISMAMLRLFGRPGILENNIVQTGASAGEAVAAGAIFTLPALVLMGYWDSFRYLSVVLLAGLGGLLGVMLSVPLRRALVVEQALRYPEGVATAAVLRAGHGGDQGAGWLLGGAALGALVKLAETGARLWPPNAQAAAFVGQGVVLVGANLSGALMGIGYIVGINISILVFAGGATSWLLAIPLFGWAYETGDPALDRLISQGDAVETAYYLWSTHVRYLGVGAMLVGGLWALVSMGPALWQGVRGGFAQWANARNGLGKPRRQDTDIPMPWVLASAAFSLVPLGLLYQQVIHDWGVTLPTSILMFLAAALFSAVAGYMAGLVGSSNNPVSGVTIATILLAALLLAWLMGDRAADGAANAILIGVVVCVAAAIAGDNLQDLKAGYLLGATPWKQQVMQVIGTVSAALVMAPILDLLLVAYGFGAPTETHPQPLAAPQATLMAAVANGVFGGHLPWGIIAAGAAFAALVIALDTWLQRRGTPWRAPVLAVAVGLYLPFELAVPILAGGLIAAATGNGSGAEGQLEPQRARGTLMAAGLITGEAVAGVLAAIPIAVSGNRDILAISDAPYGALPGLLILAGVAALLTRAAKTP